MDGDRASPYYPMEARNVSDGDTSTTRDESIRPALSEEVEEGRKGPEETQGNENDKGANHRSGREFAIAHPEVEECPHKDPPHDCNRDLSAERSCGRVE